jgi:hypothetical protein
MFYYMNNLINNATWVLISSNNQCSTVSWSSYTVLLPFEFTFCAQVQARLLGQGTVHYTGCEEYAEIV